MQLGELTTASVGEVAALPVSAHAALANEYAELQARTKRIGAVLDAALEQAYGGKNEPGTSHTERDGFDIKVTVGKTVAWDAEQLNDMAGDDSLLEWMDWTPKVQESRYKAAPERIRSQLDKARTVKLGKARIEFKVKEG